MAGFSFLNNVGTGPGDVDDDEGANTENQAFEQAHAAASKAPVRFNMDQSPDYQKQRGQAATAAKNAASAGLERLSGKYNDLADTIGAEAGGPPNALDYEGTKQRLAAAPPEKYGNILLSEAQKHFQGNDLDEIMSPVEDAVKNYKQLTIQQQPQQEASLQGSLAAQDQPGKLARAQQLDQQIAQAQKDIQVAGSARQADQLKQYVKQLQDQKNQLQFAPGEEKVAQAQATGEPPIDKELTFDHIATAAGIPRHEMIQAMTEMARMVQSHGVKLDDPVSPMTFPVLYANMIKEFFNPQVAGNMLEEIAGTKRKAAQQEQAQDTDQENKANAKAGAETIRKGLPNVNQQIQQAEARRNQVWQELAHSGNFNSVLDTIGFVLTSFLIGPRGAAMFFSNMNKNGNLRHEMDQLNHETAQLYHQQDSYVQMSMAARNHAAERSFQAEHLKEVTRHNKAMESAAGLRYAQNRSIGKMFTDPETQKSFEGLMAGARLWRQRWKDLDSMADDRLKQKQNGYATKEEHAAALQKMKSMKDGAETGVLKFISDNRAKINPDAHGTPLQEGTFEQ